MLRRFISILFRNRILFLLFIVTQLIASVSGAFEPLYIQKFLSAIIGGLDKYSHEYVFKIFAVIAVLYLLSASAQGAGSYTMSHLSSRMFKDVRIAFFSKIINLPISFFRNENQGEFVSKFNTDLGNTEELMSQTIPQFLFNLLTVITILAVLFLKCDIVLVVAGVAVAVLSSILVVVLNKVLAKLSDAQRQKISDINRVFDETVQGVDTLKIYTNEEQQYNKFERLTETFRKLTLKSGKLASMFSASIYAVMQYGNLLILVLAYRMITSRALSVDSFLLFFFYLVLFQQSFNNIVNLFMNFQPTLVSLKRLNSFFEEKREHHGADIINSDIKLDKAEIKATALSFSYPGGKTVFKDVKFTIENGETVLIVGPSGSGKTTLINLLLRFYKQTNGIILFNNRDIDEYPLVTIRNNINVVTQDHFIFEDTLRNNLTVANQAATDTELLDAIKKSNLHEWYKTLPNAMDSIIGPRGKKLSTGERQRLCLARAFLRNTPLLILDEPFANLDSLSQKAILKVVANLKKETTLIIISHQPIDTKLIDRYYMVSPQNMSVVETSKPFLKDVLSLDTDNGISST